MRAELVSLAQWEESVASERGWALSLSPERMHARRLSEVLRDVMLSGVSRDVGSVLVRGMRNVVEAMGDHFPGNVFLDVDVLVRDVVRDAVSARGDVAANVSQTCARLVSLHRLFGRRRVIRFRYVHDFLYGFDWAKWVRRDPVRRAQITAFHPMFLDAMISRAYELQTLIAQDDATYCELPDDRPRNPFGFSREPMEEIALHTALAIADAVPVRSWDLSCKPTWDRPYAQLRLNQAERMGMLLTTQAVPQPLTPE